MRFTGKTVVVTGGAGGLGRAVCAGFAEEGARTAVLDVNPLGTEADLAIPVDVRDAAAVRDAMATVHAELGRIDVLVALAGGSLGTPRDLADITEDDLDLVLDVNVKGSFHCCQAILPYLSEGGAIVLTSSIGGRTPSPVTGVPYAAAKAAITGLTRRLAREVGPLGIRVNAIAPGLFLTDRLQAMFAERSEAEQREVIDAIPLRRMPELREAVDPILFLCSRESSYITGIVLDVNGGRFMPP